jgi:hypothetical protein
VIDEPSERFVGYPRPSVIRPHPMPVRERSPVRYDERVPDAAVGRYLEPLSIALKVLNVVDRILRVCAPLIRGGDAAELEEKPREEKR